MEAKELVIGVVESMQPISLDEMDGIKLMNRVDTKYIMPLCRLPQILELARDYYRIMEVNGSRVSRYSTLYYDTESIDMYRTHQRGKLNRQKLRTRTYIETSEAFLEIKNKTNRGRTKKKRISIPEEQMVDFSMNPVAVGFVAERARYRLEDLRPTLYTRFSRITLVNNEKSERVTIDLAPSFENVLNGKESVFDELVIVELKQSGNCFSKLSNILLRSSIHPFRVSKYCLGMATTNPDAPKHRIKWKIRYIDKMIKTQRV